MPDLSPDKYAILAQILRWAGKLEVTTAKEMYEFVIATLKLEHD